MRVRQFTAISSVLLLCGCASFEQTDTQVYRRFSGDKLQQWLPVQDAAMLHWPYAWSAVAAYQDSDDPKRKPLETTAECPEPHDFLSKQGWTRWDRLPLLRKAKDEPEPAADQMRSVHLRAEVWSSAKDHKVIVAFGGTAASSLDDWEANLRWLLAAFDLHDEYEVLTKVFVPEFVKEYKRKRKEPGGEWLSTAQVIATGHSLGGGLAQRFAYSLHRDLGIPAVTEVYAFDPSPVSGKRSVPDFENQADGLIIYRIYNRGEILASVRSILQLPNRDNSREQGQTWIDIRYKDHWSWRTLLPSGSVHAHGMYDLASFMKQHLPPSALSTGTQAP
jgi:hypothetical protein